MVLNLIQNGCLRVKDTNLKHNGYSAKFFTRKKYKRFVSEWSHIEERTILIRRHFLRHRWHPKPTIRGNNLALDRDDLATIVRLFVLLRLLFLLLTSDVTHNFESWTKIFQNKRWRWRMYGVNCKIRGVSWGAFGLNHSLQTVISCQSIAKPCLI